MLGGETVNHTRIKKYEFIKAIVEMVIILGQSLMEIFFLSLKILFVGFLVHQIIKFIQVVHLYLEEPAFLVR